MSKERLEEIKEQYKYLQGDFMRDDIGWLIEQAERAEESERQMFTTVENTEKLKNMLNFKIKLLEKQNKRYRDVIEIAIHNMKGCSDLGTVFALNELERVLEGEE